MGTIANGTVSVEDVSAGDWAGTFTFHIGMDSHEHEWDNGVCNGCQTNCEHVDANGDGKCDVCVSETDVHTHEYENGVCNGCGTSCTHTDVNGDGACDDCTLETDVHEHDWNDGACTGCGTSCTHEYVGEVTTESTCTKEGVKTYTCNICGNSYTESLGTSHNLDDSGECLNCDYIKYESAYLTDYNTYFSTLIYRR